MRLASFISLAVLLLAGAVSAQSIGYQLPTPQTPPELADEGAQVVVANCSACHSLDYIVTQPRGKGEQFWRDSVAKMISVYGAPIAPEQAQEVGTVLAARFGGNL
jgi:mono/diheme cytochrome c family protein